MASDQEELNKARGKELAVRFDKSGFLKGTIQKDKPLYAWDAIHDCLPEECPIRSKCSSPSARTKCVQHQQYLDQLINSIRRSCPFLDESQLFRFGMQVIPLYSYLWRLKTIEMGLGIAGAAVDTKHGPRIHPVYKELRDTMRAIDSAWKGLGMVFSEPVAPESVPVPAKEAEVDYMEGDPTHYDKLASQATLTRRRGVIR